MFSHYLFSGDTSDAMRNEITSDGLKAEITDAAEMLAQFIFTV